MDDTRETPPLGEEVLETSSEDVNDDTRETPPLGEEVLETSSEDVSGDTRETPPQREEVLETSSEDVSGDTRETPPRREEVLETSSKDVSDDTRETPPQREEVLETSSKDVSGDTRETPPQREVLETSREDVSDDTRETPPRREEVLETSSKDVSDDTRETPPPREEVLETSSKDVSDDTRETPPRREEVLETSSKDVSDDTRETPPQREEVLETSSKDVSGDTRETPPQREEVLETSSKDVSDDTRETPPRREEVLETSSKDVSDDTRETPPRREEFLETSSKDVSDDTRETPPQREEVLETSSKDVSDDTRETPPQREEVLETSSKDVSGDTRETPPQREVPETSREDVSNDTRETPPQREEVLETCSEGVGDDAGSRLTESQGSTIDSSGKYGTAIAILHGDLHEAFSEDIEPFLAQAEGAIARHRFDLWSARTLVLKLRELGQTHTSNGCTDSDMEVIVIKRILMTVEQVVILNQVNTNQEENYDPRQTMTYLLCAMAVFPCTVHMKRHEQKTVYHLSVQGAVCFQQWANLESLCAVKTQQEGVKARSNMLQHNRLLLDLAAWLEEDRTPVAHMIAEGVLRKLSNVMDISRLLMCNYFTMSPLSGMEPLQRLIDISAVVKVSCYLRHGLPLEEENFHQILKKVNDIRLPPDLAVRYDYLYARLLQNCGENLKALDMANKGLEGVKDVEQRREFEQLIHIITTSLEAASQVTGPPDPQWLEGTNAEVGRKQMRTDRQDAARENHYQAKARRKKDKTVSVSRRRQTPSPVSSVGGQQLRGITPNGRKKRSRGRPTSGQLPSLYSSSPGSVNSCSASSVPPQIGAAMAATSSIESPLNDSDLDDSSDREKFVEREIRFRHMDNQNSEEDTEDMQDKTVPVSRRRQTPSPVPSVGGQQLRGITQNGRQKRSRSSSLRHPTSGQLPSLYSSSPGSVNSCSASNVPPQIGAAMAATSSIESPLNDSDLDDSSDQEEFVEREIRFRHMDDQNSEEDTEDMQEKTVPVSRRRQTPSPVPSVGGQQLRGITQNGRQKRSRSSSLRHPTSGQLPSLYSSSPGSVNSCSASNVPPQIGAAMAATSSIESPLNDSDLDDSSDQEEFVEREIRFRHMDDQNSEEDTEDMQGAAGKTFMAQDLTIENEPEDDSDWFEKSELAFANGIADEDEEENIELSKKQKNSFNKEGRGKIFYQPLVMNDEAESLLKTDPNKYKRCQLKIERAHKSVAKVMDSRSDYSEILIEGRSKAGQTYMDDEVVVEIISKPAGVDESTKKMVHGKVVGLLNRVNYRDIDHPVLFCTLDEIEGHLMKPLCKTVPKVHVLNELVKKKHPALKKNMIELKMICEDGDVKHTRFFTIEPDKREQYVFRVVIVAWRKQNIYPLGAVLSAHIGGRDYAGGLTVLSMQHKVPKRYPRAAVRCTKILLEQTLPRKDRLDLTSERIFTIDPPGSKDLDDAISIQKRGTDYIIGVHIADVAAVVKKDSGVDIEAKKRAVTFYPLNRRPHAMFPEPLSHGKFSLLENKERLAISVFFTLNDKGEKVDEPVIKKTMIKSCQQLTYEQAQKVIDRKESVDVDAAVQDDIRKLHKVTFLLKEKRQKQSMLFVPFEDPRLSEMDKVKEYVEAHSLIEELMILTNATVADYLTKHRKYRDVMLVRCHKAPTWEELGEWREKEGPVTNLVMELQGKKLSPNGQQLSFKGSGIGDFGAAQQNPVTVQKSVWNQLCQYLKQGDLDKAKTLAFMDALHPLQCLAASHWMNLMETAEYRCCHGLNGPDRRHFGLNLDVYTHFTSPIRRYTDLHVQRLIHACLDNIALDCTPDDVTALCLHANSATARQKAFSKGCMSLKLSENLQCQPLVFRAYVDRVDTEQLTLLVASLLKLSDRKQELPFSVLGVSSQPELITDVTLKKDSVTVQWNKRVYDKSELCPPSLRPKWEQLNRSTNSQQALEGADQKKKVPPLTMYINPDQLSESVRYSDWMKILRVLTSASVESLETAPLPLERVRRPANGQDGRDHDEVDHMTCEKGDKTVSLRPVRFKKVYTKGQVLQIQISAEPKKGLLKPRVEMLQIAHNTGVCTQHVNDPVSVLTNFATRATRDQQFNNYDSYLKAWMPLLEMEAAMEAANSDGCIVIDNVPVALKKQGSANKLLYRGTFTLNATFCFDRCIDFGGKSSDTIKEEEFKTDNFYPLDYLCLRYKTKCSDVVVSRAKESGLSETVDSCYTWLAHGSVVQVNSIKKKAENGEKHLLVTFVLATSSPQPPQQLLTKDGDKVTLELLRKSDSDRRAQMKLLELDDSCELAQAIAYGSSIPKLDSYRKTLGKKQENNDVAAGEGATRPLPRNNNGQAQAIQMALTNSLALVQGPPGTGKTNTGIKLVYLFCKINRQLEAEGKGKQTVLYCGPSNKSVDLVARELRCKLGSKCPKIVRMYGSAIERKDFPIPRGDLNTLRGLRDLRSDLELGDITLHYLIRENDRPYAAEIKEFDSLFEECIQNPNKFSVTSDQIKCYRKLLTKAAVKELLKYEVVLTTTAVGGNPKLIEGTMNSIYQVIIDECAMSTEPNSMVPIIATQAKQVVLIGDHKQLRPIIKCQRAAELGLDQSLFERLFTKFPAYTVFLDTQYRMHPQICEFPSKEFYESKLKTGESKLWCVPPLDFWPRHQVYPIGNMVTPHFLIDVRGTEETLSVTTEDGNERSKSNSLEAEKVIEILSFLKQNRYVDGIHQVKILTQYNAQRSLLERKIQDLCKDRSQNVFNRYDANKLQLSTVVSSQGGEWNYVILSTVRSMPSHLIEPNPTLGWCRQNMGFITDRNQVNVALTRARQGLFIVGNVKLLQCDEVWCHLVERYRRLDCVKPPELFPPPPPPHNRQQRHQVQTDYGRQLV